MHLAANLPHKIFAISLGEVMHRRDMSKARGELMHCDFLAGVLFFITLPLYSHLSLGSLCFSVAENLRCDLVLQCWRKRKCCWLKTPSASTQTWPITSP